MDIKCYLSPVIARSLPDKSNHKELASCALRNLWHIIYDPCPSVLELCPPDGKKLMESFLEKAQDKGFSMSWSLHVHFLDWIMGQSEWCDQMTYTHKKELLAASALRWASDNMTNIRNIDAKGILTYCPQYVGFMVGAHKSLTAIDIPKLKLFKFSGEAPIVSSFSLIYDVDSWTHSGWNSIPL
jgi:hypothetical protein